jgi:hypothetical protein
VAPRRSLVAALTLGLALAACASPASAKRLFVPKQHRTIQKAVQAAASGDTIWVAPGVYRGPIEIRKSKLVLFSDGGPDTTILDGGDTTRVVLVEGVNGGAIVGFGIRHGKANAGGGIRCVRDTTYEIRDCTLRENWESGISVWESQGVSVGNCKIEKNKGSGVRFQSSLGVLFGGTFKDNEGYEGAGLTLVDSRLVVPLRGVLFEGNHATGSTGGAFNASDSSEGVIANCTFRRNRSDVAGGGAGVMQGSSINVSQCLFESNQAPTAGAIQVDHSQLNVGNSVFDRNSAKSVAGAVGILSRQTANVNPVFANNTFYQNSVVGDGATCFFIDVSPEVRKNIFVVTTDQRAVSGLQTSPRYDCNLIWDPSGGTVGALPSANTWVGDPLFCDAEHGDFKLRDLSPALRAPCGPIGALSAKAGCSTFRLQPAN